MSPQLTKGDKGRVSASGSTNVALNTCMCVIAEMNKHANSMVFGTEEAGSSRYATGPGAPRERAMRAYARSLL